MNLVALEWDHSFPLKTGATTIGCMVTRVSLSPQPLPPLSLHSFFCVVSFWFTCACVRACICTHTKVRARTRRIQKILMTSENNTCAYAHIHTHMSMCTQARAHARAHDHPHAHTRKRTCIRTELDIYKLAFCSARYHAPTHAHMYVLTHTSNPLTHTHARTQHIRTHAQEAG